MRTLGRGALLAVVCLALPACAGSGSAMFSTLKSKPGMEAPGGTSTPEFSGLPAIPQGRQGAGLTETLVFGKNTELRSSGVTDNGNAAELLPAGSGSEWAMYRINSSYSLDSVSVLLDSPGTSAYICIANYDTGVWEISGPFGSQKTCAVDEPEYMSPSGNLYVAVVASGGNATVSALSVRTLNQQNDPPTAAVQADVASGNTPLSVQFNASASADSDGTIIEYAWDWDGDGLYDGFSDASMATHVFTSPGLFEVKLRVTDEQFGRDSATVQISVTVPGNQSPVADIQADTASGDAPLTVHFDAIGSTDFEGAIVRYDWDFDGDMGWDAYDSEPQMAHTFIAPGLSTARVRVTDNGGSQDIATLDISTSFPGNDSPVADLQSDVSAGTAPLTVEFDASNSSAGADAGDSIVSFEWDWDGDGLFDGSSSAGLIDHTYLGGGNFNPNVRVTDEAGNQAAANLNIDVNSPPVAEFRLLPDDVLLGDLVRLDGSLSSDSDGTITRFEWDKDGNGSFETDSGTDSQIEVQASKAGILTLRMRVEDSDGGTATDTATLFVKGWDSKVIDAPNDTGYFTSLVIANGNPAIAYYDFTAKDLRFVRAQDPAGTSWGTPLTLDSTGDTGFDATMQIVGGRPAIGYYDNSLQDLRFVRASDANGAAWDAPITVDSVGNVGRYASLLVVNGNPAISYQDGGSYDLRYVRASDADGTAWSASVTVDSGGSTGVYTSLKVAAGNPAIAYYDSGLDALRFVRASNADGSAWGAPITVDSNGGAFCSLALIGGLPAISYKGDLADLRFILATVASGAFWNTPVIVATEGDAQYTSLAAVNGKPAICFHGGNDTLRFVRALESNGSYWDYPVTVDVGFDTGKYNCLSVVNGNPVISYQHAGVGNLRFSTGWGY